MTDNEKPADDTTTPPWGDDFDPARAWQTIVALRGEVKGLKGELLTASTERDEAVTRATEAETKVSGLEEDHGKALTAAQRDLYLERAIRKHGIDEDLAEFLTGADEESILKQAERLASLGKPADKGNDKDGDKGDKPAEDPKPNPATRPAAALLPGHGADPAEPVDAAKLAAEIRATR